MEEVNMWASFISSYGFPIVCCVVMFRYLEKERDVHKEELKGMTKALNENTSVIKELQDMITKLAQLNDKGGNMHA